MQSPEMTQSILRPALVLGLMSALGPFTIDMYLPAMPAIGTALGTDATGMQRTLTAYFVAFGLAQMIYGPWADQAGRRLPLHAGFALFAVGTLICILAPSAEWLMAGRFVQGLGGGALGVIPRAIIRDMLTGHEATRMMATVMLVFSVSPMLAPLAGSALLTVTGWRGIFVALLIACAVSAMLLTLFQPETLPRDRRRPLVPAVLFRGIGELLRDRHFLLLTFIGAFGFGSFMIFLSAASYVYSESFGLTPSQFSIAFACNAIFFFSASQMAARLGLRFGVRKVLLGAAGWFFLVDGALFLLALSGHATLVPTVLGMGLANAGLGLIIPTVMVLALDGQGDKAGLASSFGGTMQTIAAAILAAGVGPFLDGTPLPMLAGIALAATVAFVLTLVAMKRYAAVRAPA
jgi:DHA1 family bicyclomycin/chloramphenicol resistance-like MFS transporter